MRRAKPTAANDSRERIYAAYFTHLYHSCEVGRNIRGALPITAKTPTVLSVHVHQLPMWLRRFVPLCYSSYAMIDYFPSTAMGTWRVCVRLRTVDCATLRRGFAVGAFIVGEESV